MLPFDKSKRHSLILHSEKVSLFEHGDIDKYSLNEIPINQDCVLMSEIYMGEFDSALVKMLENNEESPYAVGYVCRVVVRKININSIELSWYPNTHTRFHEVSIAKSYSSSGLTIRSGVLGRPDFKVSGRSKFA